MHRQLLVISLNNVFHDFIDKFVVVYLEDNIVYSESMEGHRDHLRRVLIRLRECELYVKEEKCKIDLGEIKFLGQKVN